MENQLLYFHVICYVDVYYSIWQIIVLPYLSQYYFYAYRRIVVGIESLLTSNICVWICYSIIIIVMVGSIISPSCPFGWPEGPTHTLWSWKARIKIILNRVKKISKLSQPEVNLLVTRLDYVKVAALIQFCVFD